MKGHHLAILWVTTVALAAPLIGAEPIGCGACIKDECPPSDDCRAGLVPDRCGCCMVCGRIEGEKCDNSTLTNREAHYGSCGENLVCLLRDDLEDLDIIETVCVCKKDGAVCGTDGRTYASVCKLKQEASLQPDGDLGVREWSPCESAPVITSKPENVTASINDDLALSCEVRGYPIPSLIWEFESAATGRKIKLPGDDQMIALQVRGGPESFMVSSWVQILRVRSTDAGIYSCTVVSKKGIVRAEASVQVTKRVKLFSDKRPPAAGSVAKSAPKSGAARKSSASKRSKESIHQP